MTQQKNLEGRGGSTLITKDGKVEHTPGTIGADDPKHREALAKTPVNDQARAGTVNRVASFADLNQEPPESIAAIKAHAEGNSPGATPSAAAATKGGSK